MPIPGIASRCFLPTRIVPILIAGKEFSTLLDHPSSPRQGLKSGLQDFPQVFLLDGARMFQNDLIHIHPTIGWEGRIFGFHHVMVESWPQRFIGILGIEPIKTEHL